MYDERRGCMQCLALREIVGIRDSQQLAGAIDLLRAKLDDATLTDVTQPAHCPCGPFTDLARDGPWPDYIEYHFRCAACGGGFRLVVDTVQAFGGRWEGELECY